METDESADMQRRGWDPYPVELARYEENQRKQAQTTLPDAKAMAKAAAASAFAGSWNSANGEKFVYADASDHGMTQTTQDTSWCTILAVFLMVFSPESSLRFTAEPSNGH